MRRGMNKVSVRMRTTQLNFPENSVSPTPPMLSHGSINSNEGSMGIMFQNYD